MCPVSATPADARLPQLAHSPRSTRDQTLVVTERDEAHAGRDEDEAEEFVERRAGHLALLEGRAERGELTGWRVVMRRGLRADNVSERAKGGRAFQHTILRRFGSAIVRRRQG